MYRCSPYNNIYFLTEIWKECSKEHIIRGKLCPRSICLNFIFVILVNFQGFFDEDSSLSVTKYLWNCVASVLWILKKTFVTEGNFDHRINTFKLVILVNRHRSEGILTRIALHLCQNICVNRHRSEDIYEEDSSLFVSKYLCK